MASILQQIAFPWSDPITSGLAADYLSWAFLMIVHLPISFGLIADRFYGLLFVCYGLVKKWASTNSYKQTVDSKNASTKSFEQCI
jgi:hypothetical protein